MIINETKEKLVHMRLSGILKALEEQQVDINIGELGFEERLGLLIDREYLERENRKLTNRLKQSKLKGEAIIENIDFRLTRGLDKTKIMSLASCEWVRRKQNIIITGPTGIGKTYLSSSLAQKACREGFSSIYYRATRLFEELDLARSDGTHMKLRDRLGTKDVLVLDDWGLQSLTEQQSRDLAEIMEDRYDLRSTIIVSQVPIKSWHELIANPTVADAILDRLVHNAHKIDLQGGSMRKQLKGIEIEEQKG
jgi:DNA replication protein DnaC